MSDGKRSFVLYHDIRDPLELLTDSERGRLLSAILDYSEYRKLPDFDGALQMAFAFIRTALDRDAASWEDKREKRREAGSRGGQQTAANRANAVFAKQNEQPAAIQAVPAPVLAPVPAPVPASGKGGKADRPPRASRFIPPTAEEVAYYCKERQNSVDAQRFVDFYEAKGWKVGKEAMRDWRAAVRTWERRNQPGSIRTAERYTFSEGESL